MTTPDPTTADVPHSTPSAFYLTVALFAGILPWVYFSLQQLDVHFAYRQWTLPLLLLTAGIALHFAKAPLYSRFLIASAITLPLGYVGLGVLLVLIDRLIS